MTDLELRRKLTVARESKKNGDKTKNSNVPALVEDIGVEPMTSNMPC